MFGISSFELLIIFIVGLLVLGPERMPEVVRGLGKIVGKLKRFTDEARSQFEKELEVGELKKTLEDFKKSGDLQSLTSSLTELEAEAKKGVGVLQDELSSQINEATEGVTSRRPILTTPPKGFNPTKESLIKEPLRNVPLKNEPLKKESIKNELLANDSLLKEDKSPHQHTLPYHSSLHSSLKKEPFSMDDLLSQNAPSHKLTEPYTKSTPKKALARKGKEVTTDWQAIVNQRQLEILAEGDQAAQAYYDHIKEKYQRKFLTEEERHKRYTERMIALNRPR